MINVIVLFTYFGQGIADISEMCFPYIGEINYETLGGDYRSSFELDLTVEE